MYLKLFHLLFILYSINGFKNNTPLHIKNFYNLSMKPKDMLDVLTSIREYTIITDNDNNRELSDLLNNINKNSYFININNLIDKENIIEYLKNKYSHLDSGENLWIFYKGFILGSREVIYDIVKKKNILDLSKKNINNEIFSLEQKIKDNIL